MTRLQVDVIHAMVRASQICAAIALVVALAMYGWWGLLVAPASLLLIWAWQVFYENIP